MAVTGRDQKERAPQCLAGTELTKGLGMLEGAASAKQNKQKRIQNCSGDLNPNMRSQTGIRNGLVDIGFKLPSFLSVTV